MIRAADIATALRPADALIVMPPFAHLDKPSFAAHLLQALARQSGFTLSVLYANYLWAAVTGEELYEKLSVGDDGESVGERLFSSAAFGGPPLGRDRSEFVARLACWGVSDVLPRLLELSSRACEWSDEVAAGITGTGFRTVGCTTAFEQTCASVAILRRVKERRPGCVTLIGGANCEGEMADGMASLPGGIDFVFSGESERTFVAFMEGLRDGRLPASRILHGSPCTALDTLPLPDYTEFYEQRARFLPDGRRPDAMTWLLAEGSRGCWWGEKHHCAFCGCNACGMEFREKSPDRVVAELKALRATHPTRRVIMADRIMPRAFLRTVMPRLAEEVPGLEICYEQKANLSLEEILVLRRAGVMMMQPGIESLSTAQLHRMRKGVSVAQNVALLRYARSAGVLVHWNLLFGLPGDEPEDHAETLALLPLVHHLHPPRNLTAVGMNRFSPYVTDAASYGVTNLRPPRAFAMLFPEGTQPEKLSFRLDADYETATTTHPEIRAELERLVRAWREAWGDDWRGGESGPPRLSVRQVTGRLFRLEDTRGLPGGVPERLLSREEAAVALVGRRFDGSPELLWGVEQRLGVVSAGFWVPLATSAPELLGEFEREWKARGTALRLDTRA